MHACGRIQAVLACSGIALLPIAGGLDTVGLVLLSAAAAASIPLLARDASGIAWWMVALWTLWWVLAAASLSWSDTPQYAPLLSAWTLVLLPALLPLRRCPAVWIWSLGAGVAAQTVLQLTTWKFITVAPKFSLLGSAAGGLHWYPPYVGMWAAAGLMLLIGLLRTQRGASALAAGLLVLASAVGVILSSSLACWVAVGAGGLVVAWQWASTTNRWRRVCWLAPTALVIAAAITLPTMWQQVQSTGRDISQAAGEPTPGAATPLDSSMGLRLAWWHAGWELLLERPLTGHGAGSVERSLAVQEAKMPSRLGAAVPGFLTVNPHCSLISTAIEQGMPGVLLLLATAAGGLLASWRLGRTRVLCGLTAAWVTLLLSGLTHAVLLEPYTAALASLLVAASLARPPLPCAAQGD